MKNAETRWNETLEFIRQHPLPVGTNPTLMDPILQALRDTPQATRSAISPLMTQDGVANRPQSKPDRNYRRACIMLKCRFLELQANWPAAVTMVNNQYRNNYANWYKIELEGSRDAVYSTREVAQRKLFALETHTEEFMRQYPLRTFGKPTRQKETYGIYMVAGIYNVNCTQPNLGKITVDAINVPAVLYADTIAPPDTINQIQATVSSVDRSCNLVLTTQFSGCCYCFMINGQDYAAAHIDPGRGAGAYTGDFISAQLRANGGFQNGNGGTFKAYGRIPNGSGLFGYEGSVGHMIIVAVRGPDNTWKVYAQHQNVDGSMEVRRIDV